MISTFLFLVVPIFDVDFSIGAVSRGASAGVDLLAWTASRMVSRRMILSARL